MRFISDRIKKYIHKSASTDQNIYHNTVIVKHLYSMSHPRRDHAVIPFLKLKGILSYTLNTVSR